MGFLRRSRGQDETLGEGNHGMQTQNFLLRLYFAIRSFQISPPPAPSPAAMPLGRGLGEGKSESYELQGFINGCLATWRQAEQLRNIYRRPARALFHYNRDAAI